MSSDSDSKDKKEARTVAIVLILLLLALGVAGMLALPLLGEFSAAHLEPGLGLKDSAVIAFIVTIVVMVIFAFAAGDGFIGEIQFMLGGFFSFFVVLWLLIAWIF